MRKIRCTVLVVLIGMTVPAFAATPEAIDKSIAAAREWIYKQQNNGDEQCNLQPTVQCHGLELLRT